MPKRASCLLICPLIVAAAACRQDAPETMPADASIPSGASAAVVGPALVAATSELALVAHWDEIVGPTRGPDVTFENRSDHPLVVLPNLLRFELEGVPFVPFPGPPIDPGGRAFLLAPGERRRVPPLTDGVWRPSPGEHVGRGRYVVTEELARHAAIAGTPWIGALDVPPGTITVPAPSTSAGPSPLAAPPP